MFIRKQNIEILQNNVEAFQKVFLMICVYDVLWLLFKFNGYFLGKSSDKDTFTSFSKLVYILSFINLIAKLILFGSLYIQVSKMQIKKNKEIMAKGRNSHNMARGSIRIA